jgi:hypothetical protein
MENLSGTLDSATLQRSDRIFDPTAEEPGSNTNPGAVMNTRITPAKSFCLIRKRWRTSQFLLWSLRPIYERVVSDFDTEAEPELNVRYNIQSIPDAVQNWNVVPSNPAH